MREKSKKRGRGKKRRKKKGKDGWWCFVAFSFFYGAASFDSGRKGEGSEGRGERKRKKKEGEKTQRKVCPVVLLAPWRKKGEKEKRLQKGGGRKKKKKKEGRGKKEGGVHQAVRVLFLGAMALGEKRVGRREKDGKRGGRIR